MRGSIWVTLVASVVALTGCSEFITTDKPAPTSVVDVVGDPSDPVAESTEQSDILGAENSATVQIFADSDSDSANSEPSESETDALGGPSIGTDQANAVEKSKIDRLKTTKRETNVTK